MTRRGDQGRAEEGRRRSTSRPCFGAVTVSYNVDGVEVGPQARRRDDRRHLPRQDQEVERPGDREARTRASSCRRRTSRSCHRSDESGTTKGFTDVPRRLLARRGRTAPASTSRSSGRPAPAPRATTASPPASSRPTARSATSSRPTRCRTTSRSPTSRTSPATSSRRRSSPTSAAGEGLEIPGDLRFATIDAPGTTAYPITSLTFLLVYKDIVQGRHERRTRPRRQGVARLRAQATGQDVAKQLQYAPLPDDLQTKAAGRRSTA